MANKRQISYGATGTDVTDLQKMLNQNGYNLEEDGIYGSNTQAAVKDYQKLQGLAQDGIVGAQTWSALQNGGIKREDNPNSTIGGTTQSTTGATTQPAPTGYQPSDTVAQAQQMLNDYMAQKPGEYQSTWQGQMDELMNQILNRKPFEYDVNSDALYQQYKDQYMLQGQQAMMDTMGQAAALTGGYGNSYAQTAGQQIYQGYLQQLNDKIPDLYQLALNKYQLEGNALADQYAMLGAREDQDYGRYRDSVSDYYTELQRLYSQYNTEREYDYGMYIDDRNYQYQQDRDAVADQQWQTQYDEAVRQWQAEFDESKRQYDQTYALKAGSGSSSSSGSSGSSGSKGGNSTSGTTPDVVKKAAETAIKQLESVAANAKLSVAGEKFVKNVPYLHAGGDIDVWRQVVYERLKAQYNDGTLTDNDVVLIAKQLGLKVK